MNSKPMLVTVLLGALAFGCSGEDAAGVKDQVVVSDAKHFKATFRADPAEPQVGENRIEAFIENADAVPMTGLELEVDGVMPSHGHSLGEIPKASEKGEGKYSIAPIVYTMPGIWQLTVHAEAGEIEDVFRIDYEVH